MVWRLLLSDSALNHIAAYLTTFAFLGSVAHRKERLADLLLKAILNAELYIP